MLKVQVQVQLNFGKFAHVRVCVRAARKFVATHSLEEIKNPTLPRVRVRAYLRVTLLKGRKSPSNQYHDP